MFWFCFFSLNLAALREEGPEFEILVGRSVGADTKQRLGADVQEMKLPAAFPLTSPGCQLWVQALLYVWDSGRGP